MTFEPLRRALAARVRAEFRLDVFPAGHLPHGGFRAGAVLVPLLLKDGEPSVLLTRRGRHLSRHPGQLSFPGGAIDRGESALEAALREAREEVGLDPAEVEILGRLDETLVLASPFRLTPWVGRVPYPYAYAPHPGEVEEILFVPLAALSRSGAHHTEVRAAYGVDQEVHVYEVGGEHVFGATARILWQLLAAWRSA
ncbi:MAG TPA: CoA pyrophosphatase [Anaeromyxobacteraceae bacterium]